MDNSTCINSPDGFACLCDFGLTGNGKMSGSGCTGKKLEYLCTRSQVSVLAWLYTADECSTMAADCVDNATCINSPDGFVCLCDFGLFGDGRMSGSGCTGEKFEYPCYALIFSYLVHDVK